LINIEESEALLTNVKIRVRAWLRGIAILAI